MPSPRRSVLVAVLLLMAGLAFAGCGRAQPGVAFYIGDTRYTEKQLDEIVDEIRSERPAVAASDVREVVVNGLVLRDLGQRVAKEKSVPVPPADYTGMAQRLGLSENVKLVRVIAESTAATNALIQVAELVPATDKDLRDIYEVFVASGQQVRSFEQEAAELRSSELLPRVLGTRDLLVAQAKKVGVEVNPRYLPLTVSIGEVAVPLTDGTGIVVDEL
jgi:hypothetical protein